MIHKQNIVISLQWLACHFTAAAACEIKDTNFWNALDINEEAKWKLYCVEELEEDEEAGCLLKFMKHAKSHTYHKHDLGYAFREGKGEVGDITSNC